MQSNWIRDKGFGMGRYVPRIKSPVTGKPEAAPSTGFIFEPTEEHLSRWRAWWRFANREQLYTFVLITFLSILFTSLLAYSTVYGKPGLPNDIGFLQVEGEVAQGDRRRLVRHAVLGHRRVRAVRGRTRHRRLHEPASSRTSSRRPMPSRPRKAPCTSASCGRSCWSGCVVVLAGFAQPLVLLVISACVGGVMMFIYSGLLILLNRKVLPDAIRIKAGRIAVLGWSVLLFGVLSVLTVIDQGKKLLGD